MRMEAADEELLGLPVPVPGQQSAGERVGLGLRGAHWRLPHIFFPGNLPGRNIGNVVHGLHLL